MAASTPGSGTRPRRRARLLVLGAGLTLAAFLGLLARAYSAGRYWTLGIVAFSPYLMLGAPLGLLVLLVARRRIGALIALALTLIAVSTQLRLYTATTPPRSALPFTVLTANLRLGRGEASAVLGAVRRHAVDALMLEELTPDEQQRLQGAGLDRLLPYHVSRPGLYADGTGLWSRYPLHDATEPAGFTLALVTARVEVPGLAHDPTLVALHMAGPVPYSGSWLHDIARLPALLRGLPTSAPVIVGGDFNATPDTEQFRAVLTHGYADAADQAGAGMTRTYPADRAFPPLIAIDHVLTRGGPVATAADTVQIDGSDHRALLVRLALPR